ncbi:MAG: phosphatidylserine decarboxylase [Nanoarchaeota archaeon]
MNSISVGLIISLSLVFSFLIFWKFWFLRDPNRIIPAGENIVSPADGKIVSIKKIEKKSYMKIKKRQFGNIQTLVGKDVYLITIVMDIFNVHVQRAPIKGKVTKINYSKGKFLNAIAAVPRLENEKNEITIDSGKIKVIVIQIAGFVARRIVSYVSANQNINKGERIGMIKLGSQVCLIIPSNISLKIKVNDVVYAGESIIGEIQK